METHLLGIHYMYIFSRDSMAGQTLNDRTTDATMVPAIVDHLIPKAISKKSTSAKWRAQSIEISACRAGAN